MCLCEGVDVRERAVCVGLSVFDKQITLSTVLFYRHTDSLSMSRYSLYCLLQIQGLRDVVWNKVYVILY